MHLISPDADAFSAGLYLLDTILDLHGDKVEWTGAEKEQYLHFDRILGTDAYRLGRISARALIEEQGEKVAQWQEDTRRYRLY